jgi:shikimate dehydrogenase
MNAAATSIDRCAVLGDPVEHSKSPAIHAAFAAQTGQRLAYERRLCPLDGFAASVKAFAADGARGCNVTVPFKFEALAMAGHASERARLAGAANVLSFDGPEPADWRADNSDGIGLVRDLTSNAGATLRGARVLLVGAGGAAAGVLGPLIETRPALLAVANRNPDRAQALVASHARLAAAHSVMLQAGSLAQAGRGSPWRGFDVVVNATSSSLAGALASPVPAAVLSTDALVVDLMYGPAAEPFLAWAQTHGATARDGLGMLVEQAAEAFFIWRGVRPDTAPVLAAMRAVATP